MKNVLFALLRVLLLLAALFFINSLSAQTFTEVERAGFNIENQKSTGETVTVSGNQYEVFITKTGSKFISCVSPKTGNQYAVWLGTETEFLSGGERVRQTKTGKYFVLKIAKSGNPYPVYLEKSE